MFLLPYGLAEAIKKLSHYACVLQQACLLRKKVSWLFNCILCSLKLELILSLICIQHLNLLIRDFPGGTVVKNPPANAGDMGSSPGPGRSHMPWSN